MDPKTFDAAGAVDRLKEMEELTEQIFATNSYSSTVDGFYGFMTLTWHTSARYAGTAPGHTAESQRDFWESMREQAEQGRRARQGSRESWGEEQRRRQQERGGPSRRSGPYAVLGVDEWCDKATALEAYRREAKVRHPDVGGSKEAFQELQNAWDSVKEMRGW